jgi:hypothetical protein
MRKRVSLGALLFALSVSRARGQSEPPLTPDRRPVWGLAAGYGSSVDLNRGRSRERLLSFEPSVGLRLSNRLEYVAEAHFAQYFRPKGYVVGLLPLGGRLYLGRGRTLPYFALGGGLGWTDLTELDEIDQRFNFLVQASVGVRGALSGRHAWVLELRLAHLSNGGMERPNLGLNTLIGMVGWRF